MKSRGGLVCREIIALWRKLKQMIDYVLRAHTHPKTQSILLLLYHNETSMGRECYNFILRQQLSVLYSTSFQTLHWVPFIMGHWGKNAYYDLVKSSLAAEVWFVEAGLFFGMMKLQSRKTGTFYPRFTQQMVWCGGGGMGICHLFMFPVLM